MHAHLRGPNKLLILRQILIEPDFPCLADEIAKLGPDMNIKVSEKSINICLLTFADGAAAVIVFV